MIDAHIHVLPNIDDGSKSVEISNQMLEILKKQGIDQIIATPHFYAHKETSIESYLQKRQNAYEKIGSPKNMLLGAEIAIEKGISQLEGIEKLAFQQSDLILLEFPFTGYAPWMEEEIYEISITYKLKPVLAHIHRYIDIFTKEQINHILQLNAIFQVNNEAFGSFKEKKFVKKLIKDGYPIIFGSDSHNLDSRKPNWDLLLKKAKQPVIDEAMDLLKGHFK